MTWNNFEVDSCHIRIAEVEDVLNTPPMLYKWLISGNEVCGLIIVLAYWVFP